MLSQRIQQIAPSMTMAVSAKAAELKAQGEDVISFGSGEPDFPTPEHICQAATKAMQEGMTHYTAVGGLPELKQAIVAKFARDNHLMYSTDEVIVSCGAKHSIYNVLQALLDAGDEVIIPSPYWVSYPDMVKLAEGVPVVVECDADQDFKMSAQDLEEAITPKTKVVFLNSPSNPTGRIYRTDELQQLAQVLRHHQKIFIISDDIYEHLIYTADPFQNILNVAPDLRERCIIVNGVSKAYAMTGWRIGYCAAPKRLVAAMQKLQGQCTSNPNSIAQIATIAALEGGLGCVQDMLESFTERNQLMTEMLSTVTGLEPVSLAEGAFYQFIHIDKLMQDKNVHSDIEYAELLISEKKVAVVPGTPFGLKDHIRFSFATSNTQIEEGISRLRSFHQ